MANAILNKWLQYIVLILLVTSILFSGMAVVDKQDVVIPSAREIAAEVIIPTMQGNVSVDNSKVDAIYDEIFKDDYKETLSEQLCNEEMDKKSFKEELFDVLEAQNISIESYKDITRMIVKDSEVNVVGEEALVSYDVKVYFYIDGDEEETEKARIEVEFDIEDLDEDDDYEDAEVEDYSIVFTKLYD